MKHWQLVAQQDQTDSHQQTPLLSAGLSGWKNQLDEDCQLCQLNVLYNINKKLSYDGHVLLGSSNYNPAHAYIYSKNDCRENENSNRQDADNNHNRSTVTTCYLADSNCMWALTIIRFVQVEQEKLHTWSLLIHGKLTFPKKNRNYTQFYRAIQSYFSGEYTSL